MWVAVRGSSGSGRVSPTGRTRQPWVPATIPRPGARPTCASIATEGGLLAAMSTWPSRGRIEIDGLALELRATEAGQVGLFPEHAAMLPWLREQVAARAGARASDQPPAVLHLFAYTGLVTLAVAAAGASVVHVDASRPTVAWARRNADISGLAERPVRWIVDDAVAFTEREVRRGRRYAGIVLDPPSYGHGPDSGAWRIEDDLPPLLAAAGGLLEPDGFVLLTAHTAGFEEDRLAAEIETALRRRPRAIETGAAGAVDRGRADPGSRAVRTVVGRGIMTPVTSPTPPVLTSFANPRVKAARALRDRRERDRTGLTLIDGAREVRRALDAGVEIVEAFVCDPLLAGPDARAALDLLRARARARPADERGRLRQARVRRARRGDRSRSLASRRWSSAAVPLPDDPLVVVIEGVEKPGNLGAVLRSADGAGADAVDRRLATDRPVQPERDPGQRRDDLHASRSAPPRRRT